MPIMKYGWVLPVFIILLLLSGCSSILSTPARVENGVLDLNQWDFNKDGNIKLNGEWEFYWHKLLNYKDLQGNKPDLFSEVPKTWNEYSLNGKKLPGEGYATYRLHVRSALQAGAILAFRVYTFSSAYRLYINEKLIASNGIVSAEAAEEVGEYRPQAAVFNIPANEFDIIIQVSNFHYARGGFWYSLSMGSVEEIYALHDSIMEKEAFLIGAFLIIALFYFAVYILNRELRYTLYFALFCIWMIVAADMVGQLIIPGLFPGIGFNAVISLWYSSLTWTLLFLILFVHKIFQSLISGVVLKVYLVISVAGQLLYAFTPPTFYARLNDIVCYCQVFGILCAIIIVAIGIKKGNKDGWLNIISIILILITYMHDDLYLSNIIRSAYGEILYAGLFLFAFIQMVIQAQRIRVFHEHKYAAELAFLQAQIKPHFLYNSLNTFISISRYDVEKARTLLYDFSNYLRRSFDLKSLSQFVPLKNEIELVKAYVEIEKARFEGQVEVYFEIPEDLEYRVPILILQPLVENAIVHGILPKLECGRVDIAIQKLEKKLFFKVVDNGMGMDAKKVLEVRRIDIGKGIGIVNINSRLKKLYGKGLEIISSPESGTEITWHIPINKKEG